MIRIIENCYSSKWLKISIQIHKEFFSSVRPNLRELRVHFSLVHQLHNSHCTWSRTELGIIIRVQRRIRTHGEEFGLASEENAIVPVWQLHPGTIVLCAPINSAHAVIRDIVVVHAKCILPAPHSLRYLDDRYRLDYRSMVIAVFRGEPRQEEGSW